ncbi:hypothetical protein ACFWNN_01550 [Lentzea sp. NPDC058450]|uniref:hypothetical protein n=1 Tax=Lentzea sp. NPDC058450 TaxID=3346505 RepID=UPI003650DE44
MIDQLPDHRPLPADVRMRARQRLSEGMDTPVRNGRPVLIAAGVSLLAAGTVFASQALLGTTADVAAPPMQHNGEFVGKDRALVNNVEKGVVAPDALARCTAVATSAHPPAAEWTPIATSRKNGTVLSAFRVPAGVFFCANTATTTTLSAPDAATVSDDLRQVKILFTTPTGAMAGLVSPDVKILGLSRVGDKGENNEYPGIVDGLFFGPTGFTKPENGTMALVNGHDFAVRGVPKPTKPVVDRPLPPADRETPEQQNFAKCLRDRPIPDADQFAHAQSVKVSGTDTMILGRFNDLLLYCRNASESPTAGFVIELDDLKEVRGTTIAGTSAFYDFTPSTVDDKGEYHGGGSNSAKVIGLVLDPRATSITYTSPGVGDASATIAGGTFVLNASLLDRSPEARVVVRDAAGKVLETITPQNPS